MATTFRFPAVWAAPNRAVTLVCGVCGTAALTWMNVGVCDDAGGGVDTTKGTPLLAAPLTVTTTLPAVAPVGTAVEIWVLVHVEGNAKVPLKRKVLVPADAPKL